MGTHSNIIAMYGHKQRCNVASLVHRQCELLVDNMSYLVKLDPQQLPPIEADKRQLSEYVNTMRHVRTNGRTPTAQFYEEALRLCGATADLKEALAIAEVMNKDRITVHGAVVGL